MGRFCKYPDCDFIACGGEGHYPPRPKPKKGKGTKPKP